MRLGGCVLCGGGREARVVRGRAPVPRPGSLRLRADGAPAAEAPLDPRRPLVVEPSWVLTWAAGEARLLRDHHVVVADGAIVAVAPGRRRGREQRLPAPGQLLLPGLVSGHTHVAAGTVTRGVIEGGRAYGRPLELADELPDDLLDDLTAANLAELLRGGCTTQVEMSLSLRQARSYVRAAERLGARGYVGAMVPGIARLFPIWFRADDGVLEASVPGTLVELEEQLAFGRAVEGAADGRIRALPALHATDTHTPATLAAAAAVARELGNGLHLHLAQSAEETAAAVRLHGRRPAELLADAGLYDGPLLAAHLNGADVELDAPTLRAGGATAVHCPSAGGAGGVGGWQPWPELLAAGVRTAIGVDTHSNDLLENVKLAVLYARARGALVPGPDGPRAVSVADAVRAATLGGADGLGRADLGRIEPGACADLVSVDVTGPLVGVGAVPPEPLHHLLYAHGRAVRHVLVDGRVLVRDGALVVEDEGRLAARGGAAVQRVWDQLAAEGWLAP